MDKDDKNINDTENEEIIDTPAADEDAEFEKALAAVENSKTVKIKNKEETFFAKFAAKCAQDKIILLCLVAMVLCAIGAIVYFLIPVFYVTSFDMTVDEFRTRYTQTEIYTQALHDHNCQIPEVEYVDASTVPASSIPSVSASGEAAAAEEAHKHERFFSAPINTDAADLAVGIQGRARSVDNKVTAVRVVIEYIDDPGMFDFLRIFFSSYLMTCNPDLELNEAYALTGDALYQINSDSYLTIGNTAFRASLVEVNGVNCVAFDIVPSDSI